MEVKLELRAPQPCRLITQFLNQVVRNNVARRIGVKACSFDGRVLTLDVKPNDRRTGQELGRDFIAAGNLSQDPAGWVWEVL